MSMRSAHRRLFPPLGGGMSLVSGAESSSIKASAYEWSSCRNGGCEPRYHRTSYRCRVPGEGQDQEEV